VVPEFPAHAHPLIVVEKLVPTLVVVSEPKFWAFYIPGALSDANETGWPVEASRTK
jgi:hypothetical protein